MTHAQRTAALAQITAMFQALAPPPGVVQLAPVNTDGKLYELRVLAQTVDRLVQCEKLNVSIANGPLISFRATPGAVDRTRSWLEVRRGTRLIGELMTDLEFITIRFPPRRDK